MTATVIGAICAGGSFGFSLGFVLASMIHINKPSCLTCRYCHRAISQHHCGRDRCRLAHVKRLTEKKGA